MAAVGADRASRLEPGPGERLDRLARGRRVLQRSRGHRSGTDDVLAAWLAWTSRPDAVRVLDLGCGHGTVSLLLSALMSAEFVAVEAQAVSAELARRNVALNGLLGRVSVHHGDLRAFEGAGFDLATGTPPFLPPGTGVLPQDPQRAAARFELRGGVEDYAAAAARALRRPGGRVSLVMDGAQDERCRAALSAAGFGLVRRLLVHPCPGKPLRYIGYVGELDAPDAGDADEPLLVRDDEGRYTAAMARLRRRVGVQFDG